MRESILFLEYGGGLLRWSNKYDSAFIKGTIALLLKVDGNYLGFDLDLF